LSGKVAQERSAASGCAGRRGTNVRMIMRLVGPVDHRPAQAHGEREGRAPWHLAIRGSRR